MRAVVCNSHGTPDALELAEVERPTPSANEVLIKIHATVCSTASVGTVASLGTDRVLDYTKDDFTDKRTPYDVVFDAVGKNSFRRLGSSVKRGGTYLTTDLGSSGMYRFWRC